MSQKETLIETFQDTQKWCLEEEKLVTAIKKSITETKVYEAENYPELPNVSDSRKTEVTVTMYRTFRSAMLLCKKNPEKKIAVHNFASATNPGGGVTKGSRAQEECLCRCSTLYPVLNVPDLWSKYYNFHRKRHDMRYTDTCIYSPGIWVIKTDTEKPERMIEADWCQVDVITCAAPNLRVPSKHAKWAESVERVKVSDKELLELHKKRARHMLTIAAAHGADILVLGAFGCGAFQNKPEIVARAYKEVLKEFEGRFQQIEFAVYCTGKDTRNYEVFKRVFRG